MQPCEPRCSRSRRSDLAVTRRAGRRADHQDQAGAELEVSGSAGDVLPRGRQGLLQSRRPRRHARPGQRLGRRGPAGCQRHLRCRLRRHQCTDRACREQARGCADRGLRDVQPAAVHGGGEVRQPDQDAEGFRGQEARRRRERRRAQAVSGALQARQDRLHQGQHHQHAAEPARADADAGSGRRRVRLRQHHPLLRQADGRAGQSAPLHQLRRLRHGPLLQRHHRLEEAGEGQSEGGRGPGARAQQGHDRCAQGSRWRGRSRGQARAADQGAGRIRALCADAQGRDEPSRDRARSGSATSIRSG